MAGISPANIGEYVHSEVVAANPEPIIEDPVVEEVIPPVVDEPTKEVVKDEKPVPETPADYEEDDLPEGRDPWSVDHLQGEDGLVAGKYKNVDAMVKSLEHAEAKLTELMAEKQSAGDKSKNADKVAAREAAIAEVNESSITKYLESGRSMTPELAAEINASGGDVTSVELQGIKRGQQIDKLTGIVGGEDNFKQMITDMSEGKTEAQKQSWLAAVGDPEMSEYAVKGLHAEWLEQTGQRAPTQRVKGQAPQQNGVKPYANQAEMLADAGKARNDRAFRSVYEARKNITPDSIFFNK